MKKARIVLTVVLVSGMTAGMLAWKAKRYMAQVYYTCNTYWVTCFSTWTIGDNMTTLPDINATLTVNNATPFTGALGQGCVGYCTWSNTVYIEPGF